MTFLVVGSGIYSKEKLIEYLRSLYIPEPEMVVAEAEKGRVILNDLRILCMRSSLNN